MQQRRNITCLQLKTHKNYYLSTSNNKEELLPVYNTQQRRIISCLNQTTNRKYDLSTTNNTEALLHVYSEQQRKKYYLSTTIK
jgi:hypothetical protein